MKRILLIIGFWILAEFACPATTLPYTAVFFKVGATTGNPNVSVSLIKQCKEALTDCSTGTCYVFAVIPSSTNQTLMAITNGLMPLSQAEEAKYASYINQIVILCNEENGVIPWPTPIPEEVPPLPTVVHK